MVMWLSSRPSTACRATRLTYSASPARCSAPARAFGHSQNLKSAPRGGRADAKARGVKFARKSKLTPHQQREAIRRRDVDGETQRSIGRSYNVSPQTISRLAA